MNIKRISAFILVFVFSLQRIWAQDSNNPPASKISRDNIPCPKAYLGLNLGVNNPNGLMGFSFEIPLKNDITLSAGAGAGQWGTTIFGESRYYLMPCQRGWAVGGGISHSSGRSNYQPRKLQSTVNGPEHVSLDLLQQTNLYLSVYRSWNMGKKRNKFYATAGWSVPLRNARYRQIAGSQLASNTADKVRSWAPGGLILGVGIYFGIH